MDDPGKKSIRIDEVGHLFLSGQKAPPPARREEVLEEALRSKSDVACIVAICSARGDVARPLFSVNLAMELSRIGRRTAIFPQISLAPNAVTLLGLSDITSSGRPKDMCVLEGPFGISLCIPESESKVPVRHLTSKTFSALDQIARSTDFLLLEIPNSIARRDITLLKIVDEAILLVTPDPDVMTDAFRHLTVISEMAPDLAFWIVAHGVDTAGDGEKIFREMEDLSEEFLDKRLEYLGHVCKDPHCFLTCIEDPGALIRGRFSRVRKCMHEIVELLCIADDLSRRTSGPRHPLSKRC